MSTMMSNSSYLDLYSTSPTKRTRRTWASPPDERCQYASIWFAYASPDSPKAFMVSQGCCNHWDCPRCGQIRAKTEYRRIVDGIHQLSREHDALYFLTFTCRGEGLSPREADAGYLAWTNKLLDAFRLRVKRGGGAWVYVQVTERQKRGLPHSHLLTTFQPGDLVEGCIEKWEKIGGIFVSYWKDALRSDWLQMAVCRSGLGEQYDISVVRDEKAASRYVAKYMFKPTMFTTDWPKGWKRVRYSESFPKLPEQNTSAFVLRTWQDWDDLGRKAVTVRAADEFVFEYASWKLRNFDTIVTRKLKNVT